MADKSRKELKDIFVTGARPTQEDFSDWLDNYVHKSDHTPDTANSTGHYYVSRSYTGAGAASVTATDHFPVSANASYNAQLQLAERGNMQKPYPDPYAARAAAMQDLAAGSIQKACIIINAGDRWTVGSDNPVFNGDRLANPLHNETADIQFAGTHAFSEASLLQDKMVVVFGQDSGFDYINTAYAIYLGYVNNPLSTAQTEMAIAGKGKMVQVYGAKQGFSASLIYVNDPNLTVGLSFGTLCLNQSDCFLFDNVAYNKMSIDAVYSYEVNFIRVFSGVQSGIYSEQAHDITIKAISFGNRYAWLPMAGPVTGGKRCLFDVSKAVIPTSVNMNLGNVTIDGAGVTPLLRTVLTGYSANRLKVNLNIDILHHTYYGASGSSLINTGFANGCQNKQVTVYIKNGYTEQGIITAYGAFSGAGAADNFVRVHCDNMVVNLVNPGANPYAIINSKTPLAVPYTNCHTSVSGHYNLVNCGAYTSTDTAVPNGGLVVVEDAVFTMSPANTLPVFTIPEKNEKLLVLKNIVVKCPDTKLFANTSGGTPGVFIQNVATTDTAVINTINYEGDTIKTIPSGYFK